MTIAPYGLDVIARVAATAVVNSLLAGIVTALVAWVITRLCNPQGSGTRFAVWLIALIAVASLPWVGHSGSNHSYQVTGIAHNAVTLPASLAVYLTIVWIVGAALGLIRVGFGLYRIRRLRSTCTAVDLNQLHPSLRASLVEAQTVRRVTLCSSDVVRVPAAIGYFRPAVVFPAWVLQETPAAELNAILTHELAHLRRWDDWTNLVQKIVKAVFFFHPAVWFIESRLSLEREMACDDAVLAANFSPRAYAESLVGLAEKSFLRSGVQLAQAAVSHVQQLKMRIAQILRKDRQGTVGIWKPAVAMMALAAVVAVDGVSRAPRLIAFGSDAPQLGLSAANARAVSASPETQLRPVKASFAVPPQEASAGTRAGSSARPRVVYSIAFKRSVAFAQRTKQHRLSEDEFTAPPMIVLSKLPAQQNSAAPSAVLVVMRGEQFGVGGPIFWQLRVYRITQLQKRVVSGVVPTKT